MDQWVEEVLFRGRPPSGPGSDQPPCMHVVIGMQQEISDLTNPGATTLNRQMTDPMPVAAALKFGYTPDSLVAEINLQLAAANEALMAEVQQLRGQIENPPPVA